MQERKKEMNKLLRNYIEEDKKTRSFTYNLNEDVNIFIDNIENEFPGIKRKERVAIYATMLKLTGAENEFFKNENLCERDLTPTEVANYELIWINHMKELIEKL